ncbi:DinB family protein [Runella zeae]|uniref:DinB family protein n=1 Tax=Runella zeae TaxID=94255 RepID=UPI00048C7F99|nr:DinB family protein [Runella zeae]
MTELKILTQQTESVYDWTHKLIKTIPFDKWDIVPDIIESNISWQVGHLIMSHYYHSIMVIVGHQMDVIQKIPLKNYDELFTNNLPKNSVGKINPSDLLSQLSIVQQKSISIIKALSLTELENKLEPTPTPHPIAKTKFEAIDWNIKHTMYHCGQIGIIKRIIDERYDFGLRKTE